MELQNREEKVKFFNSLNERDKRRYAAIEAESLGWGGITTISSAFGIHRNTITKGIQEMMHFDNLHDDRIRKQGGGRKKNS